MRWNRSNSDRASATVLPFSRSVMSDAEALEIAQPDPSNAISEIRSSSICTNTVTRSPHSGL
jgi:hypothetical protein